MVIGSSDYSQTASYYSSSECCASAGTSAGSAAEQTAGTPVSETDTVSLTSEAQKSASPADQLTEEEKQEVTDLKQRDREVRSHEAAHMAAGGGAVRGGATFSYQSGPDGKRYAVGGEVGIDTSGGKTPEETIRKMQIVRKAALAPASPSGQDRSVAAAAASKEAQARQELNDQRMDEATGGSDDKKGKPSIGRRYGKKGKDVQISLEQTAIDLNA